VRHPFSYHNGGSAAPTWSGSPRRMLIPALPDYPKVQIAYCMLIDTRRSPNRPGLGPGAPASLEVPIILYYITL
jgi:hypothetical protein